MPHRETSVAIKQAINRALNVTQGHNCSQGCNARKVNSEVYASFVLQCTVSGR